MLSALVMMLLLMATRRYGFIWETTILGAGCVRRRHGAGRTAELAGFQRLPWEMILVSNDSSLYNNELVRWGPGDLAGRRCPDLWHDSASAVLLRFAGGAGRPGATRCD